MTRKLLLLSTTRDGSGDFLVYGASIIREFFGPSVARILFVPYAGVTITHREYADLVAERFAPLGLAIDSLADVPDPVRAVHDAQAMLIGGGNTFHLLKLLYDNDVLEPIKARVAGGMPYMGWSAGSVVTAPTISTTNDMAIVEPHSLRALAFIPFHINAHYTDFHPPGHQGETRAERLEEFIAANPSARVLGLREGSALRIAADEITLLGPGTAPLFARDGARTELAPTDDLRFLLHG